MADDLMSRVDELRDALDSALEADRVAQEKLFAYMNELCLVNVSRVLVVPSPIVGIKESKLDWRLKRAHYDCLVNELMNTFAKLGPGEDLLAMDAVLSAEKVVHRCEEAAIAASARLEAEMRKFRENPNLAAIKALVLTINSGDDDTAKA
ncbi:hypothetical protein K402DRAFT_424035 [Aulographum hederae CBS 113979]|uniref:Uncharacterized protein n=1 Tax=Aulographum hederae CBS 113979 TaxID=1176131 RepID=A0A6G1GQK7_9PEZI|nr:hypothetical protein K402DRAFT_424035 [Aulographum hederae CBS 113979]